LTTLSVSGTTAINTNTITSAAAQIYAGAVTLGADTALSGVAITLSGTVNSDGTNRSLTINDSSTTTLTGAIGGNTDGQKLSSLTTNAGGNTVINGGAVRTTLAQTYGDAVTLGADTALTASTVTTKDVLVGNTKALTITGGAVFGDGAADTVTGLTTLSVSGTTAINTHTVTSTAAQTYTGGVTLGVNTTLSGVAITLGGTVKSDGTNRSLTINDSGSTTLGGVIGGSTDGEKLSSLTTDSAGTIALNGVSVTTSGAQTYGDAVTLGADTTLTASTVSTQDVLVGNTKALTITGNTVLGNSITDTVTGLASLSVSGTTAINTNTITTTGTQTYAGAVSLAEDTTLSGSTITTQSTLAGGTKALTITGSAVLGDGVADTVTGLTTLSVSGTTAINTNTITSVAAQTYTGAVTLGADTTLSGVAITLGGTVKSYGVNRSLTINDSGATTLTGAIGGSGAAGTDGERLASLTTDAGGSTAINGGSVRSSGAQTYGDAVTLGRATTLAGSTLTTLSTVAGNAKALLVTGNAVLGDAAADTVTGLTTLSISGTTAINTDTITSTGAQTYTVAVTLGANTTLSGVAITLGDTVKSDGTNRSLTINDSGATTLGGAIGGTGAAGTEGERLTSLTTDAGGTTAVNGGGVRTAGAQIYGDAVTLGNNTTLSGVVITLGSTVKSDGTNRSLTIKDSGATTLTGAIGGSTDGERLASLTTDAGGSTAINGGSVRSSGAQTYGDAVTLGAASTLAGNTLTTLSTVAGTGNALTITGNAVLGDGVADTVTGLTTLSVSGTTAINTNTVTSAAAQTYAGAVTLGADTTLSGVTITLSGTVNSDGTNRSLTINDSSTTTLTGAIGGNTDGEKLSSLTTNAGGNTLINGGAVRTTGVQTYGDAVTLGADTLLSGSTTSTQSTVAGNGKSLTIAGNAMLGLASTDTLTNLNNLSISGTTVLNVNALSTSGSQTYGGALSLTDNTTLTGSTVTTQGTVAGGGKALTIAADAVLGNSSDDSITALSSLSVSRTTAINTGVISCSGAQTFTGAVTLGADTALSGVGISLSSTLKSDGTPRSLTINDSGATTLSGAIGGTGATGTDGERLASLSTNAGGSTVLNGASVRTSGAQTYGDVLTLSQDTTLSGSSINTQAAVVANNKSLTITGNAVLGTGALDTLNGVNNLSISGTTTLNVDTMTSAGTQTYGGALNLTRDTVLTGTTVTTQGTVAGSSKALTIAGNAVLGNSSDDTVSGLTTLAVSGSTGISTGAISSSGAQTFTGAVTLGADTALSGVGITLGSTLKSDGTPRSLTINDTGATTLSGAIGGTGVSGTDGERLASLSTNAGGSTVLNGASVRTSGAQTYGDALTLTQDTTLSGNTVTTQGTLVGGSKALTIAGNAVLGNSSNDTVSGLTSLSVTGTSAINTAAVTTSGAQTYTGAVTLGTATTLSGTSVQTGSTIAGGGNNWTVGADAQIGGNVTNVNDLTITGATRLAGNISTTGNQTYTGTLRLLSDATLSSTGNASAITLIGDIDSVTTARALSVNATGNASRAVIASNLGSTPGLSALAVRAADITFNSAQVQTTGEQSYTGAITLASDTTLTASTVRIGSGSDITGAGKNLTLVGNASLGGQITGVNNLSVSGDVELGARITATGAQQFGGTLALYADTTLTANSIGIAGAINADVAGAQGLTLNTGTGPLTLSVQVGAVRALKDLSVTAGQINLPNGQITTTGAQTYDGAVALTSAAALTGSTVYTMGTVTGNGQSLQVTGNAQFDAVVSGLSAVSVSGATLLGGNVTTSADQTYTGAVTLANNSTLTGATITTGSSVAGAGKSLTLAGNANLGGNVTNVSSLNVSRSSRLGGNVSSTGAQTYSGAVTLGADSTLTGVGITLGGTVKSSGGNRSLVINDSGATTLAGAIGGSTDGEKLSSLTTNAGGNTLLNGGGVRTTGAQTYGDAVTLGADTTLTGVSITLGGTVKSSGGNRSLVINDSGTTTLAGAIGSATAAEMLSSLTTDAAGTTALNGASITTTVAQTFNDAVTLGADTTLTGVAITLGGTVKSNGTNRSLTINDSGTTTLAGAIGSTIAGEKLSSLVTDAAGMTSINGASITTTGAQTFNDDVTLGADTTLTGVAITLGSTVKSSGGNRSLVINDSGTTTLAGAIGSATAGEKLSSITTDAAGTTALNGASINTKGAQTFNDAVTLGADTTLTGVAITLGSTVKSSGGDRSLVINDSGTTTLAGAIGSAIAGEKLSSITTDAAGTTAINGASITTTGAQTYGDAVTLGADTTLTGVAITLGSTVKSSGGNRSLVINDSGTTTLAGAIGGATAGEKLSSITTDAAGTLAINGASINTTGAQTFNDALTLGADTTLSGVGIALGSTVKSDGTNRNLTINDSGTTTLAGAIGSATAGEKLSSITTDAAGTTALNGASINTKGAQTFNDAVTLGADTTLTGVAITLGSTVKSSGGNRSLVINDSGTTTLAGAIGSATAGEKLSSITTDAAGTTAINGASINTTGAQTFGDAVTLGADTALTASMVSTQGTVVGGNKALAITGNAVLGDGAADTITGLRTLSVSGTTAINTNTITTSGDQSYTGSVTVPNSSTLTSGADVRMAGAVDGAVAGVQNLTVRAGGTVTLAGAVGAQKSLASLSLEAASVSTQSLAIQDELNIDVRNVNGPSTVRGVVSGVAGALNKRGAGALQLVAANTYTGDTNIQEGSLALASDQVWSSTGTTRVAAGAQLDLQGVSVTGGRLDLQGGTLVSSQGRSLYAGPIALSANSNVKVQGTQLNLEGVISGGAHGLNVTGSGHLVMRNEANTLASLATTQSIGALDVSNNAALVLGDIAALDAITIRNSKTLTLSAGSQLSSVNAPIVLQAGRFLNQAGAQALRPGQGKNWQVWSTNATPFDAMQGDVVNGLSNDYVQYKADMGTSTVQGQGRGLLYSYAPVITVNLEGQVSKLYDANTQASLRRENLNLRGAVNNDTLTLGNFSQGEYVSAGSGLNPQGAGTSKAVKVTGLTLLAAQGAVPVYGYTMSNTVTGDVGVITPVVLSMTIDKVYDGSNQFTPSNAAKFTGMVANEAQPKLNSGSATVTSAQAAKYPIFTTSNLGVDNPNYTLNGAPVVATIQKAPLGVSAEGNYTGTTEIKPINFSVIGLVNNETLTALEKFTVSVKEVQANDTNFVTELVKAAGGGTADLANYQLNTVTSTLADTTQNTVKIRALSTLILTTPAVPSVLPKVSAASGNASAPASVKTQDTAGVSSPAVTTSTAINSLPTGAASNVTATAAPAATATPAAVAVEGPTPAAVATETAASLASDSVAASAVSNKESADKGSVDKEIGNKESGNAVASVTVKAGDAKTSPDPIAAKVTDSKVQEPNKPVEVAKPAVQVAVDKPKNLAAQPAVKAPKEATANASGESRTAMAKVTQVPTSDGKPKNGNAKSDCSGGNSLQAGFGSGCPNNDFKGRATDDAAARFRKQADSKLVEPAAPRKGKYDADRVPEIDIKLEKEMLAPYNPQALASLTAMTPHEELRESFDSTPATPRSAITLDPRRSKASKNYYESMESVNLMSMLTLFFMP
jgi:hypothetical protein